MNAKQSNNLQAMTEQNTEFYSTYRTDGRNVFQGSQYRTSSYMTCFTGSTTTFHTAGTTHNTHTSSFTKSVNQEHRSVSHEWDNLKSKIENWRLSIPGEHKDAEVHHTKDNSIIRGRLDSEEEERYRKCLEERDRLTELSALHSISQSDVGSTSLWQENGHDAQTLKLKLKTQRPKKIERDPHDGRKEDDKSEISSDDDFDESV